LHAAFIRRLIKKNFVDYELALEVRIFDAIFVVNLTLGFDDFDKMTIDIG